MQNKKVVNGGVAGEVSQRGVELVEKYLKLFPNAKKYVIGFGTNDFAHWDTTKVSEHIINNLKAMTSLIKEAGKKPLLINMPYLNESKIEADRVKITHEKRDYHNQKLAEAFSGKVKIADICSKLKDKDFGDILHPNKLGAEVIAKEVFKYL